MLVHCGDYLKLIHMITSPLRVELRFRAKVFHEACSALLCQSQRSIKSWSISLGPEYAEVYKWQHVDS